MVYVRMLQYSNHVEVKALRGAVLSTDPTVRTTQKIVLVLPRNSAVEKRNPAFRISNDNGRIGLDNLCPECE
jgi:hypothetical protein